MVPEDRWVSAFNIGLEAYTEEEAEDALRYASLLNHGFLGEFSMAFPYLNYEAFKNAYALTVFGIVWMVPGISSTSHFIRSSLRHHLQPDGSVERLLRFAALIYAYQITFGFIQHGTAQIHKMRFHEGIFQMILEMHLKIPYYALPTNGM